MTLAEKARQNNVIFLRSGALRGQVLQRSVMATSPCSQGKMALFCSSVLFNKLRFNIDTRIASLFSFRRRALCLYVLWLQKGKLQRCACMKNNQLGIRVLCGQRY